MWRFSQAAPFDFLIIESGPAFVKRFTGQSPDLTRITA